MPAIEDSRVLVIGGAGFIGSHIVDQLTAEPVREIVVLDNLIRGSRNNLAGALQHDRVTLVEGSVEDVELLRDLMRGTDYAFHLAALWLYECVHEPRKALEANVVGTYNVVETAHEAGVKKVVYSSSASVYGNAVEEPMTEAHPFHNRTMYGATKIAGEQFFRAFHERHGLDYVGHRYMNVYGPRMDYKGTYVSVIMKVLDRLDEDQPPLIYGDGSHTYDFVHVEDVARANVLSLKAEATDTFFNIGTGVPTTIQELVDTLLEITRSGIAPEYRPQEEVFVTNRVGSTELAERLLGFRAEVDLRRGLESVVDWRRADSAAAVGPSA
jgi:nucleoside-diphosphate-sugar epimerase